MKRVRVTVVIEEVDDRRQVVRSSDKFGVVIMENFGDVERIARQAAHTVQDHIEEHLPNF